MKLVKFTIDGPYPGEEPWSQGSSREYTRRGLAFKYDETISMKEYLNMFAKSLRALYNHEAIKCGCPELVVRETIEAMDFAEGSGSPVDNDIVVCSYKTHCWAKE